MNRIKNETKKDFRNDDFKNLKKLSFDEAKAQYQEAKEKPELMQNVILGTIYVVYDYIINNNLEIYKGNSYDIEDMFSEFNKEWILAIKSGVLERATSFAEIINEEFVNKVIYGLVSSKDNQITEICPDEFSIIFNYYFALRQKSINVTMDLLISTIENSWNFDVVNKIKGNNNLWILLEQTYKAFDFDKDNIMVNLSKLNTILPLLLDAGLTERLNGRIENTRNYEESIINKMMALDTIELKEEVDEEIRILRQELKNENFDCTTKWGK